jgi:hypothetical protein
MICDTAKVACNAPYTLVFPPYPLEKPVTINWPEYETSVLSTSDGTVHTKSTKFVVTAVDPISHERY